MAINTWLVFICLTAIQAGSPGPSTVNLVNNSIKYGKLKSIFILTGDVFAICIMGLISSTGIDIFFSKHPSLFSALKILGAIYLIYLGAKSFNKNASTLRNESSNVEENFWKLWRQSFLIGISNPKSLVYYAALLPQFEQTGTPDMKLFVTLVLASVFIKFIMLSFYAIVADYLSSRITSPSAARTGNKLVGIFFMFFGTMLGMSAIF